MPTKNKFKSLDGSNPYDTMEAWTEQLYWSVLSTLFLALIALTRGTVQWFTEYISCLRLANKLYLTLDYLNLLPRVGTYSACGGVVDDQLPSVLRGGT